MDSDILPPETPATPLPRWVGMLSFAALILVLGAGFEGAARILVARTSNSELQRIASDYGKLAREGAGWIRFVPDGELSYRLRPDFELVAPGGGELTRHNANGFRNNRDFAPKPPGVLRIACYGASTTYGVSVGDNRDTYPAQLEEALNGALKPSGWTRVEVWNLGVGGYTSREILGTLKRTLPELQPDVVLLQNAINDVIPRFYPNYTADYSHFRIPFSPLEVTAFHRVAYRSRAWLTFAYGLGWLRPLSLQSQTQRPLPPVDEALANLEANPPTGFEQNLAEAVHLAREAGCAVWLLTQAYLDVPDFAAPDEASRRLEGGYRTGLLEHTALVVGLAERTGAGLIPLHEITPRQRPLFADPIHMTAPGNRVKADLIARAIAPSLGRAAE